MLSTVLGIGDKTNIQTYMQQKLFALLKTKKVTENPSCRAFVEEKLKYLSILTFYLLQIFLLLIQMYFCDKGFHPLTSTALL